MAAAVEAVEVEVDRLRRLGLDLAFALGGAALIELGAWLEALPLDQGTSWAALIPIAAVFLRRVSEWLTAQAPDAPGAEEA